MKQRIFIHSSTTIVALVFSGLVATAAAAETDHIADFIRYEVKVIKVAPDNPNDAIDMEQIVKGPRGILRAAH